MVEFDTSAGQSETRMGPADLLTTAFAACVLKNVERFSGILPFRYDGASISVTAERKDQPPPPRISQIQYVLRIKTDEPAQRVDLLRRNLERFGTGGMSRTLSIVAAHSGQRYAHLAGNRQEASEDCRGQGEADTRP